MSTTENLDDISDNVHSSEKHREVVESYFVDGEIVSAITEKKPGEPARYWVYRDDQKHGISTTEGAARKTVRAIARGDA